MTTASGHTRSSLKDKYIEAFNTTPLINSEHTDLYPDQDAYVTWKRDGNQWKIVPVSPNQSGIGAVINVTCKLKAPTADELKKLDMAVQVKCVVDAAQRIRAPTACSASTIKTTSSASRRRSGTTGFATSAMTPTLCGRVQQGVPDPETYPKR